jgi:hypothetical protein
MKNYVESNKLKLTKKGNNSNFVKVKFEVKRRRR